ncbi:MAG: hypothetical protein RIS05_124 [Actinomycetota bacterium]|jgi:hypothetical protein
MEQNANLGPSREDLFMSRWKIITPAVIASIVAIAFFSAGPRVPMDGDNTSALALEEKANQDTPDEVKGGFSSDIDLGNQLFLRVSEPDFFAAKDPAALGVEGRPLSMTITITNKSSKSVDIASFAILQSAFDSDASLSCFDVFEEASEVIGLPADTILKPGSTVEFPWAIVCPTTKGDVLHLTFSVTGQEQVTLDSTVK